MTARPSASCTAFKTAPSPAAASFRTIFKLIPSTDSAGNTIFVATVLHFFGDGSIVGDAVGMQIGVTLDAGDLYGATYAGGEYGEGCVYELSASDAYTAPPLFDSGEGIAAPPIIGLDGTIYGVTSSRPPRAGFHRHPR